MSKNHRSLRDSYFQLVNLALFVVLELAHILFQFLHVLFGSFLVVLGGLNGITKFDDGLFIRFDLSAELDVMR